MVSALKVNHRKEQNLESFIKKFSNDAKYNYNTEEQTTKKTFIDKSIQNLAANSIIEVYFKLCKAIIYE